MQTICRGQITGQPDGAHRLVRTASAWPGHTADRNPKLTAGGGTGPPGHGHDHRLAYCPVVGNKRGGHPQHLAFGGVGISDVSALKPG